MSRYNKIEQELNDLFVLGIEILLFHTESEIQIEGATIKKPKRMDSLPLCYNRWYSLAIAVLKSIGLDRLQEFEAYYTSKVSIKKLDIDNYTISHFLSGRLLNFNDRQNEKHCENLFSSKFLMQISIMESVKNRLNSSLSDIKELVQSDFFDSELESCRQLVKQKYFRAAGVICGVIIERHLKSVCDNRIIKIDKKNLTISDFNDKLKATEVIDTIKWREISYLADIRNLCGHNKEREPTKEEIEELIAGTNKIIKTLF